MYSNKKKIIIGVMCILVLVMIVVYAAFQTRLIINGTGNITSIWNIEITSITSSITGSAYNISTPTYNKTNATFNAGLRKPGDKIEYSITVKNNGSVDAIIDEVTAVASGSYAIIYTVEEIQSQERLTSGASKTFKIIVEFDVNATSIPSDTTKEIIMNINCIQDDGQQLSPSTPEVEENGLIVNILKDNVAQSDEGIDFSEPSSATNGQGLYYTSENTENNQRTYYFRGAVTNNYVSFAGFYWRIIRINEDGSIRLIYQGTTPNATGDAATIGNSTFNSNNNDNAYVGYMYGTPGSSNYAATHANTNDSAIKTVLDSWYEDNLLSYASYIADSGFCNDRSVKVYSTSTPSLGYGTNNTSYGKDRETNYWESIPTPRFNCLQENDLFTTSSSNKGNKELDYPIGLITGDEAWYAGGRTEATLTFYLSNNSIYWTMSAGGYLIYSGGTKNWVIGTTGGGLYYTDVASSYGVRPVINLKSSVEITSGTGTSSDPYVIKTS